jgi:hypothetical protein
MIRGRRCFSGIQAEADVELGRSLVTLLPSRSKVDGIFRLQVTLKLIYFHQATSIEVDLYLYKGSEWSRYVRVRIIP